MQTMKLKIILDLALILSSVLGACADETNALVATNAQSYRRISTAEVGTVKLEVEQPSLPNEIQIRVRDFAAHNWLEKEVSCDFYYISDDGKEAKKPFMSVTLKQASSNSDDYSGGVTNRMEFAHGNKFKVVYKSHGLSLPISTWYACYYH